MYELGNIQLTLHNSNSYDSNLPFIRTDSFGPWKFLNKLSQIASLNSNLDNLDISLIRTKFCVPSSKISLLFELFDSKTLQRIVKWSLNSLNFELWKSVFFLKRSDCIALLHNLNVWFTANDVSPAPMCCSKTAKSSVSRKINVAAKHSRCDRSLKLKYEVLQELDKGKPQKDLVEKY